MQYPIWVVDGQAVGHHFLGLKNALASGQEVLEINTDKAFDWVSRWELSTSQLSPRFTSSTNYGLCYSIGDYYILWTVTNQKRRTNELGHYLAQAATAWRC